MRSNGGLNKACLFTTNQVLLVDVRLNMVYGREDYPKLDDMLAIADCIVIAGTGAGGKRVINREELSKKKGSRLVNIARGSLVDEEAVADAMDSGDLFAIGLDVFEDAPRSNPRLQRLLGCA
jgi:lactate dehydrogenase-like 2-hydroxyacid dehydrogenase